MELRVDRNALGRMLPEATIKKGLEELSPGIFFDVGGRLGLDHPYIAERQGVYHESRPDGRKHICSMDRGRSTGGLVAEVPVWSTFTDIVEVPWSDVSAQELTSQEFPFPMPCIHDENQVQIKRAVRGDIILCGWRHTFDKLVKARTPGITWRSLANKFVIALDCAVEAVDMPEEAGEWESETADQPEEGKILDEMGAYEARPTVT